MEALFAVRCLSKFGFYKPERIINRIKEIADVYEDDDSLIISFGVEDESKGCRTSLAITEEAIAICQKQKGAVCLQFNIDMAEVKRFGLDFSGTGYPEGLSFKFEDTNKQRMLRVLRDGAVELR